MIKVYVYDKKTRLLKYIDNGNPEFVTYDISDDNDFTLTAPPDFKNPWRWIDNKWIADNAP